MRLGRNYNGSRRYYWLMADTMQRLKETLVEAGHRLTGPRVAVWEAVAGTDGHLTAEEITDRVKTADPSVNTSSVYRSLALFAELGLVRESNLGPNAPSHWEPAHTDEQFHLKCTSCGKVEHHSGGLVAQVETHLTDHHGFIPERVELLVLGLCRDCAGS